MSIKGKSSVLDINTILGDDFDEEMLSDSSSNDESKEIKSDQKIVLITNAGDVDSNPRNHLSDIDAILGMDEEFFDDDSETDEDNKDKVPEIQSVKSENSEFKDVKPKANNHISDIDDILGEQEEYFDEDDIEEDEMIRESANSDVNKNVVKIIENKAISDIDAILETQDDYLESENEENTQMNVEGTANIVEISKNYNTLSDRNPNSGKKELDIDLIFGEVEEYESDNDSVSLVSFDSSYLVEPIDTDLFNESDDSVVQNRAKAIIIDSVSTMNPAQEPFISEVKHYIDTIIESPEDSIDDTRESNDKESRNTFVCEKINEFEKQNLIKINKTFLNQQNLTMDTDLFCRTDVHEKNDFENAFIQNVLEPEIHQDFENFVQNEVDIELEKSKDYYNSERNYDHQNGQSNLDMTAAENPNMTDITTSAFGFTDLHYPNIKIGMHVNVKKKNAEFVVTLPNTWTIKYCDKTSHEDYSYITDVSHYKSTGVITNNHNINPTNKSTKGHLNVDIAMFLDEQNLRESEIQVQLNEGQKTLNKTLNKNIIDMNLQYDNFEYGYQLQNNSEKCDKNLTKYYLRYQLPITDSILKASNQNQADRYDFRFKLSQIRIPYFNNFDQSNEIKKENDVQLSETNTGCTDRFDFRFQLPHFEFPSFKFIDKSSDSGKFVDKDIRSEFHPNETEEQLNDEKHDRKFDFRYELPKFEVPHFRFKDVSSNFDNDTKKTEHSDILRNSSSEKIEESDGDKRFDFRFQLPTFQIPTFGFTNKPSNADQETEKDLEHPETNTRYDFRFQLPQFEFPSFLINKSGDSNQNNDSIIDSMNNELPSLSFKHNVLNNDGFESNPNTEIEPHEESNNAKRFDFRYQLPQFQLSSTNIIDFFKNHNSEDDVKIQHENQLNSSNGGGFSKYESNERSLSPKLIIVHSYGHPPTINDPIKSHQKLESNRSNNYESYISSLRVKNDPNSSSSSGEEHSDIDIFPSPIKIVKVPQFSPRVSIYKRSCSDSLSSNRTGPENIIYDIDNVSAMTKKPLKKQLSNYDAYNESIMNNFNPIESPTGYMSIRKGKSSITNDLCNLIINKPISFTAKNYSNEGHNSFSILLAENQHDEGNLFKVSVTDSVLMCCEYYCENWQSEVQRKVAFICPDKDFRVVIIAQNYNNLMILFNAEIVIEYPLKGSIDRLHWLRTEGTVELSEIKLLD